jgi:hypothetical protein
MHFACVSGRGEGHRRGCGCMASTWMVRCNLAQTLVAPRLPFVVYFYYEFMSNTFLVKTEFVTGPRNHRRFSSINTCGHNKTCNNKLRIQSHESHLDFRLICCCATKANSSHSSTCIYDRESMSPKPSLSAILHWERVNKVFGKCSMWLLDCFSNNLSSQPIYLFAGWAATVVV